jgi:hypothetical protein
MDNEGLGLTQEEMRDDDVTWFVDGPQIFETDNVLVN